MNSYYLLNCLLLTLKTDLSKASSALSKKLTPKKLSEVLKAKALAQQSLFQVQKLYRVVPALNYQINYLC